MTIEEKTGAIEGYCKARKHCKGCPLFEKRSNGNCFTACSEEDIDRNFHMLFDAAVQPAVLCDGIPMSWDTPYVSIKKPENVYINYTINHFEEAEVTE